jgi:hypothetical protein
LKNHRRVWEIDGVVTAPSSPPGVGITRPACCFGGVDAAKIVVEIPIRRQA